jgi:hypothetical protein
MLYNDDDDDDDMDDENSDGDDDDCNITLQEWAISLGISVKKLFVSSICSHHSTRLFSSSLLSPMSSSLLSPMSSSILSPMSSSLPLDPVGLVGREKSHPVVGRRLPQHAYIHL